MQIYSRTLIDSITKSALLAIGEDCCRTDNDSPLSLFPELRAAILNLGMKCICSPWPDGAISSLMNLLRSTSIRYKNDRHPIVSSSANSVLCACDALSTPRAPPVTIITRKGISDDDKTTSTTDANSLVDILLSAKKDIKKEKKTLQLKSKGEKKRRILEKPSSTNVPKKQFKVEKQTKIVCDNLSTKKLEDFIPTSFSDKVERVRTTISSNKPLEETEDHIPSKPADENKCCNDLDFKPNYIQETENFTGSMNGRKEMDVSIQNDHLQHEKKNSDSSDDELPDIDLG